VTLGGCRVPDTFRQNHPPSHFLTLFHSQKESCDPSQGSTTTALPLFCKGEDVLKRKNATTLGDQTQRGLCDAKPLSFSPQKKIALVEVTISSCSFDIQYPTDTDLMRAAVRRCSPRQIDPDIPPELKESLRKWNGGFLANEMVDLLSSTGADSVLSDGMMKPKPFWLLKNLTLPVLRLAAGTDMLQK